jgi:hypothetical protein
MTEYKTKKFNLFRLNTYMRGAFHSREAQIRRASKAEGMDGKYNSEVIYPACNAKLKGVRKFKKHLQYVPSQSWPLVVFVENSMRSSYGRT